MNDPNNFYNITFNNYDKNNAINNEIFNRHFPSNNLTMNFPFRPVNTKYTLMPTLNNVIKSSEPINNYNVFDMSSTFFPGTRKPHFCGFASNVDKESTLRNQFFALQKADQARYIPDSTSDLYENNIEELPQKVNLADSLLFDETKFSDFNPNLSNSIGNELFYNSTRVQLKDLK
jgi:hypothetical protein